MIRYAAGNIRFIEKRQDKSELPGILELGEFDDKGIVSTRETHGVLVRVWLSKPDKGEKAK